MHTNEFCLPFKQHHSFRSICCLIEIAMHQDGLEMVRDNVKEKMSEPPKFNNGFRFIDGTFGYQKLKDMLRYKKNTMNLPGLEVHRVHPSRRALVRLANSVPYQSA